MSVTFGFYNSKEGDRRYDAIQMSSIFDGIIQDGILQHVGTAMVVKESEAMIINVGVGRAWFNHTWTLNDALLPLVVPQSEILLNRYDAVVLEVDSREAVRANDIKIIKGTPASNIRWRIFMSAPELLLFDRQTSRTALELQSVRS